MQVVKTITLHVSVLPNSSQDCLHSTNASIPLSTQPEHDTEGVASVSLLEEPFLVKSVVFLC